MQLVGLLELYCQCCLCAPACKEDDAETHITVYKKAMSSQDLQLGVVLNATAMRPMTQ